MATVTTGRTQDPEAHSPVMLGGFAALAESEWMGRAQATEVLEPARIARPSGRAGILRLPRLRLTGITHRELGVVEATFVLMASFLLSAALGAVRQVLFDIQFGAGAEANAYYAAFRLPDLLFSLIAGGALSSAMIPVLVGVTRDEGVERGWELASQVLSVLFAAFAVVVVAGEILTPVFVATVLAPGFDAPTRDLTVTLTRIMLVQPLILAVGSVATAVLNSRNLFFLTALSVASHNLTLILGILASHFAPGLGIYGPTYGVVAGALLQAAILLPGLLGSGFRYRPAWKLSDPRLREVIRLLIPNGLAVGVLYVGSILDTAFASLARESAGLPAIHNAWLLVGLPIALLGQAVGQSAFPRLAASSAAGEWAALRGTLLRALGAVVALSVPALLALILLGRPLIHAVFEHGRYDAAAGGLTYTVLVAFAVGLPAYVATEVVTRGLIALRDTRTPLLTNTLQIAGRGAIMALLVGQIGVIAVPIALAVAASVETLLLGTLLWLKLRRLSTTGSAVQPGQTRAA